MKLSAEVGFNGHSYTAAFQLVVPWRGGGAVILAEALSHYQNILSCSGRSQKAYRGILPLMVRVVVVLESCRVADSIRLDNSVGEI
jgi:hypothetical protein